MHDVLIGFEINHGAQETEVTGSDPFPWLKNGTACMFVHEIVVSVSVVADGEGDVVIARAGRQEMWG